MLLIFCAKFFNTMACKIKNVNKLAMVTQNTKQYKMSVLYKNWNGTVTIPVTIMSTLRLWASVQSKSFVTV